MALSGDESYIESASQGQVIPILVACALDFDPRNSLYMGVMFFGERASTAQIGVSQQQGDTEPAENTAPEVAQSIPDRQATEDETFNFQVPEGTFNDPDDGNLSLSASRSDGSELPG